MEKEDKEKMLLEIDYLKHLQEHNMFNYNIKHQKYISYIAIIIAIFLGIFSLIANFNKNLDIFYLTIFFVLLIIILVLLLMLSYERFKRDVFPETSGFMNYHSKIKDRYKKFGIDVDELGR